MTVATIRKRLIAIGLLVRADDDDAAHSAERQLFLDVLNAVAIGQAGPAEAREALRSLELNFGRHTA